MKVLWFILQKEFKQIIRDKTILPLVFVLPLVQLGILPIAMDFEVNQINVVMIDNDHSSWSDQLVQKIGASGHFNIVANKAGYKQALEYLKKGEADVVVEIPNSFEKSLVNENRAAINMSVDAINGTKSSLGTAYLVAVISEYNRNIQIFNDQKLVAPQTIAVESSVWFNPFANYNWFIVPGIMAFLLTIFAGSISALNIVKEKEIGTIEQINVTPIKKWQFVLGKLLPFWLAGMLILTVSLLVARWFYGIRIVGSISILYALAGIYLVALLGFGLFISTISSNQLQSMFLSFFFIMIFALMSGLFTSVESMPEWARYIANSLPITYFMKALRMVILKGSSLVQLKDIFLILIGFAIGLNGLAVWNYKKTS